MKKTNIWKRKVALIGLSATLATTALVGCNKNKDSYMKEAEGESQTFEEINKAIAKSVFEGQFINNINIKKNNYSIVEDANHEFHATDEIKEVTVLTNNENVQTLYMYHAWTKDNKICYYPITNQNFNVTVIVDEENMNIEKTFRTGCFSTENGKYTEYTYEIIDMKTCEGIRMLTLEEAYNLEEEANQKKIM